MLLNGKVFGGSDMDPNEMRKLISQREELMQQMMIRRQEEFTSRKPFRYNQVWVDRDYQCHGAAYY